MAAWLLRKLGLNALTAVAIFALAGGALAASATVTDRESDEGDPAVTSAQDPGDDETEDDEAGDDESRAGDGDEAEGTGPEEGDEDGSEDAGGDDAPDAEDGEGDRDADAVGLDEESVEDDAGDAGSVERDDEDGDGPQFSAACAGVEDDVDGLSFGCYRAYQVWQACGGLDGGEREACEEDLGPAWLHPRHPAFGDEGRFGTLAWRPGDGPPPWAGMQRAEGEQGHGEGTAGAPGTHGRERAAEAKERAAQRRADDATVQSSASGQSQGKGASEAAGAGKVKAAGKTQKPAKAGAASEASGKAKAGKAKASDKAGGPGKAQASGKAQGKAGGGKAQASGKAPGKGGGPPSHAGPPSGRGGR